MATLAARGPALDVGDTSPVGGWGRAGTPLAVVVLVVAALSLGLMSRPANPGDTSAEAGFARDMAVHHAQAVGMAEVVRSRTQDPEVRALATDVALTQQGQIGRMRGWLGAWGLAPVGSDDAMVWMGHPVKGRMPGLATPAEVAAIGEGTPAQGDIVFLRAMIPHHRGGVLMARGVLARTGRREVRRLAEAIVASQRSEIGAMEAMLLRRGASAVTPAVTLPAAAEHGHSQGFLGLVAPASRSTLRFLPVSAGVFAAVWLLGQAPGRRRRREGRTLVGPNRRVIAVSVALGAAGALHLGLAPEHFDESTAYGVFFVVAAVVELGAAAAVVMRPSPRSAATAALVALALVATYGVFRLLPPPGADDPEHLDLVGVLTQVLQVAGAFGAWSLWRPTVEPVVAGVQA